jgi:hypothetical protein
MSTNTLKQALEIVYGDIKNINKRVKNLESASAGVLYNETTKSAVAYQDNVSANACPYALLNKVGGMSYKSENIINTALYQQGYVINGSDGLFYNDSSNIHWADATYYNAQSQYITLYFENDYLTDVDRFYRIGCYDSSKNFISRISTNPNANNINISLPSGTAYVRFSFNTSVSDPSISNYKFTAVWGTTTLTAPIEYFDGIRDTAITSVISKDSNNTVLAIGDIPNEIQALNGYGWGINDTCYNYIDFVNKKFIQKVGRVDLGTLEWTYDNRYTYSRFYSGIITNLVNQIIGTPNAKISNNYILVASNGLGNIDKAYTTYNSKVYIEDSTYTNATAFKTAMSGVYLYYELATPIETDISQYIDDNSIQIEANGTITFNNTYQQAIPYEYLYLEKVGANNE